MEVVQEELLHCSICMEIFSDPRGLPCQHTFCCDCLTTYIEGNRKSVSSKLNDFDCPLCRRNAPLKSSSSNGDSFPINLVITSLLNIYKSGKHRITQRHKESPSSCDKMCQTSNSPSRNKICQTYKETRCVRNKFAQTNQIRLKEVSVQAAKHVKKTHRRTQTNSELTKGQDIEPKVQRQHKATQTEIERITSVPNPGMGCSCNNRPFYIPIFQFVGDKWDTVFNRRFDNLIEKLILRYIILNIATDITGYGIKRKLKALLANMLCYISLTFYSLLMLCLFAGIERHSYVFIIILLYKFIGQALTIDLNAYPNVSRNNHDYFMKILFLHVVWFWTTFLCLCLLLYTVCLLISVRGHPYEKTVCVTYLYAKIKRTCGSEILNYPDISFLTDWSFKHFNHYFSRFLNLDFSESYRLVDELFRHVLKGEPIMVEEDLLIAGHYHEM